MATTALHPPLQMVLTSLPRSTLSFPHDVQPSTPGEIISPARLARWSLPRWTAKDLILSLHQYARETGYVEGTVYPLTFPYAPHDNVVFHQALDVLAGTLNRIIALFLATPEGSIGEVDGVLVGEAVRVVRNGLRSMLEQFLVLRGRRTDVQAGNIGRGVEAHGMALARLEEVVLEKVVGEGRRACEKAFGEVTKMVGFTARVFRHEKWDGEEGEGEVVVQVASDV